MEKDKSRGESGGGDKDERVKVNVKIRVGEWNINKEGKGKGGNKSRPFDIYVVLVVKFSGKNQIAMPFHRHFAMQTNLVEVVMSKINFSLFEATVHVTY